MNEAGIIAPIVDDVTVHSYDWSREVKDWHENPFEGKVEDDYTIYDLSGETPLTRADCEKMLQTHPGIRFIHYDHGSEDAMWISPDAAAIDLNNVELLKGREVYCMNCLSARQLGVQAYKIGVKSYWGYVESFAFTTDALEEFKEFGNAGIKQRLEGHNELDALAFVKDLAQKLTEKLIAAGKFIAATLMRGNGEALRCYCEGNPPNPDEEPCQYRRLAMKVFKFLGLDPLRIQKRVVIRD